MYCENEDPIVEVRRVRAELLEMYGGIKGYLKHVREDLSQERLEREGWRFVSPKDLAARRRRTYAMA